MEINTEKEFSKIVGMLNAMNVQEPLWIGTLVGEEKVKGFFESGLSVNHVTCTIKRLLIIHITTIFLI